MRAKDPLMDIFTHQWKVLLPPLLSKRRKLPKSRVEAILMCYSLHYKLRTTFPSVESNSLTGFNIPQLSGIDVVAVPDDVALRIPQLGLEHILAGKLKDIYALLEEYHTMPKESVPK